MTRETKTYIITGAGGVGKTTISAAAAIRLAGPDRRTVVMTVDPARRLADGSTLLTTRSPISLITGLMICMDYFRADFLRSGILPRIAARSAIRAAYPASLSYQLTTLIIEP